MRETQVAAAMLSLLIAATAGCTDKPPVGDGMEFTYQVMQAEARRHEVFAFEKTSSGWEVQVTAKDLNDPSNNKHATWTLDEHLVNPETGKKMSLIDMPFFLPKDELKVGGGVDNVRVKEQQAFKGWKDAWLAHQGPIKLWYHPKNGLLLGLEFKELNNLSTTLVDSNVVGLMPEG